MQSRSLKDLHARCHRSIHPLQALSNVFSHRTFRDEAGITIAAREQCESMQETWFTAEE
jgi:hypothetical protein